MAKFIFVFLCVFSRFTPAIEVENPASKSARYPTLGKIDNNLFLAWTEVGQNPKLMISALGKKGFMAATLVTQTSGLISNWADTPKFFSLSNGDVYFWWPEKTASGSSGYNLMLTKSVDQGKSWKPIGKINKDASDSEHGFVSMVEDEGKLRVVWVDGRETLRGGASSLRSLIVSDQSFEEELIDTRVCDCCATSTVVADKNILSFYRGRTSEETRDIQAAKKIANKWRPPITLHRDKWKLSGCPMNGPHASSIKNFVVVGWFTKAFDKALIKAKISNDAGITFQKPIIIDDSKDVNLGRVSTEIINENEAIVSWVKGIPESDRAQLMARKISSDGKLGKPILVSEVSKSKNSGFPSIKVFEKEVFLTWTEPDKGIKVVKLLLTNL